MRVRRASSGNGVERRGDSGDVPAEIQPLHRCSRIRTLTSSNANFVFDFHLIIFDGPLCCPFNLNLITY